MECQDTCNTKQSPGQKTPPHRSNTSRPLSHIKRVSFHSSEDITNIETPDEAEVNERWYTSTEYYMFRREAVNTVRKRERVKGLKDDAYICLRGLEMVDDIALKVREEVYKKASQMVMEGQRTHTNNNNNNSNGDQVLLSESHLSDTIAKMYQEISYETKMKALKLAEENHNEAQEYLEKTRESFDSNISQDLANLLMRIFCWKAE